MLIKANVLTLITTEKCTASCDNCCFSCSSSNLKKDMEYEDMVKIIHQAKEIDSIKVVVFTGGECFLLKEKLDALIELATSLGFKTRCVTNGFWAKTEEIAIERLKKLRECGLNEINFSTGENHSQFVSVESIKNGIKAALHCGLEAICLMLEDFVGSHFDDKALIEEVKTYTNKLGAVHIMRGPWIEIHGTNRPMPTNEVKKISDEGCSNHGCDSLFGAISIAPNKKGNNNNLHLCCGLFIDDIPELSLGEINVNLETILTKLVNAQDDLIKIWISVDGPKYILDKIKEDRPELNIPVHYMHICQYCSLLYANDISRNWLKENIIKMEDEIMKKYAIKIAGGLFHQKITEAQVYI